MFRKIFLLFCILWALSLRFSEAETLFPFKGGIEFPQKKIFFTINPEGKNPLSVKIARQQENLYQVDVTIDHLKTSFFDDISTVVEGIIEVIKEENNTVRALSGKIRSKYTLINYKPVAESFGQFEIKGNMLYLNSLSVGNISCKGFVQMSAPYTVNLSVKLSSVDMKDFLTFFVGKHEIPTEGGGVTGEIHISGNLNQVQLKGSLAAYHGLVDKLAYNSIVLNAEGIYPVIHISNSNITETDGMTFNVVGSIDLSDKDNFDKQIALLTKEPLIIRTGGDLEWTLKRIRAQEAGGTTEFKYLLRKGEDISTLSEGGSDMLGIEQSLEF